MYHVQDATCRPVASSPLFDVLAFPCTRHLLVKLENIVIEVQGGLGGPFLMRIQKTGIIRKSILYTYILIVFARVIAIAEKLQFSIFVIARVRELFDDRPKNIR